jgi:6 kDa early secretory antigenic target
MDLRIQQSALDGAANDLVTQAKTINSDLDGLEAQLNPLRSEWEGSAKAAYDQAKAEWDQLMREMIQVLEGAANTVRDSAAAYRAADLRGEDRFRG